MTRVVFLGTPKIAAVVLKEIYHLKQVDVVGVFCQPDKAVDRKGNPIFCEVKQFAIKNNIKCFQPENINEDFDTLASLKPDLIITCAYGQFIGTKILTLPKYKCVNFHASLLPKLRGGAPIHWAIINGYHETGWTLMFMEKKMDAGNMIKRYPIIIDDKDTYASLYDKLCNMIPQIVVNDFEILLNENLKGEVQNEADATFGYNIKKEETYIDFNKNAQDIYNQVRGLNDKPVARVIYNHEDIKVYWSNITNEESKELPGTILSIDKKGIKVATQDFNIILTRIQLPSKKQMDVAEIINGSHPFKVGTIFNK